MCVLEQQLQEAKQATSTEQGRVAALQDSLNQLTAAHQQLQRDLQAQAVEAAAALAEVRAQAAEGLAAARVAGEEALEQERAAAAALAAENAAAAAAAAAAAEEARATLQQQLAALQAR